MRLYGEIIPELWRLYGEIIPELWRLYGEITPMLYLTCTTKTSVDLAHYRVSRAKDWVSVDCGTSQCCWRRQTPPLLKCNAPGAFNRINTVNLSLLKVILINDQCCDIVLI